ncbi:MAG: hypothetical protein ACT4NL_15045 [Pseudomarimonas sp.]
MSRYTFAIAVAALLLIPVSTCVAQDQPTSSSMLTGQNNPAPANQAEQAAAEEQAQAEKAAQEAAAAQPAPDPAPEGRRGERGCKDAQGNPREC